MEEVLEKATQLLDDSDELRVSLACKTKAGEYDAYRMVFQEGLSEEFRELVGNAFSMPLPEHRSRPYAPGYKQ